MKDTQDQKNNMNPEIETPPAPCRIPSYSAPIEEIVKYFDYIDELRKKIMKKGIDYDIIPGTKKPTLLKPGAEKLAFAFNLAPEFEVVESIQEHDRKFEYTVMEKINVEGKEIKQEVTRTATGFFFYKVKCRLVHRGTGAIVADLIATCSSMERGKEEAPANTIIKISQKRCFVGSVIQATFTSDRFLQDNEDYNGYPASDKQINFIINLFEKSTDISDEVKKEIREWLDSEYQSSMKASEYINILQGKKKPTSQKKEAPPRNMKAGDPDDHQPHGFKPEEGESDKEVGEIMSLESSKDLGGKRAIDLRVEHAGLADIRKADPAGIKKYIKFLKSLPDKPEKKNKVKF